MAAFVADAITLNTTAGAHSVSITPAVNDLLVAICFQTGTTTDGTLTDNQTGGTYTRIRTTTRSGTVVGLAIWIRDNLVTSAVSHTLTYTPSGDTGGGVSVQRWSGMSKTGATAARQSAIEENASGTAAPAFSSAALTTNPVIAVTCDAANPATITEPSGWTERQDTGYNSPVVGFEFATRDSGFTGTTVTWGSDPATATSSLIVELDASATATTSLNPPKRPPIHIPAMDFDGFSMDGWLG